jgi:two-component system LytT family response regulator
MRILIVDDEKLARQLIRSLLGDMNDIEVIEEATNGASAITAINHFKPELMFLDVQMPGMSGFDVLDNIDPSFMPYIIFVSAYDKYAIKAFEIHALDYILKPFSKERFFESVERARKIIGQEGLLRLTENIVKMAQSYRKNSVLNYGKHNIVGEDYLHHIIIRDSKRVIAVKTEEIAWLEAADQYVRVHTQSKNHLITQSLKALQKKLDPSFFYRVHRSAIVNARYIQEIISEKFSTYSILLLTGERIKISRSHKNVVDDLLKHGNWN